MRNVLEASVYLSENGHITRDSLPSHILHCFAENANLPLTQRVRAFERQEIGKLLLRYGSTLEGKKKAAAELGISLATLYNKMASQ